MHFATEDTNPLKRWEIVIPLNSVIVQRWTMEEEARRSQVLGGGAFVDDIGLIGGGIFV